MALMDQPSQQEQPTHDPSDTLGKKDSITVSKRTLAIAGGFATALAATGALLLGRGGGDVNAAPNMPPTADVPSNPDAAPSTAIDTNPGAQPTDIPGESVGGPVVNEIDANPLGLEQKTYAEIMAYGSPAEILTMSQNDIDRLNAKDPTFIEEAEEKLSRALQVWLNVDSGEGNGSTLRDYNEQFIFADTYLSNEDNFRSLIIDEQRLVDFDTARGYYYENPDGTMTPAESAHRITMEAGINVTSVNKTVLNSIQFNPQITLAVAGVSADLQYGNRSADASDTEDPIGVDYRVTSLEDLQLQINYVTYTDTSGVEHVKVPMLQLAVAEI